MNGLHYTLYLLEPVLANSLAGDANSARTLPFIPGGLVRGALAHAYLRDRGLSDGSSDPDFPRLFVKNGTRYLHAYPLGERQRMLPTPLAWHKEKYPKKKEDKDKIYNFVTDVPEKITPTQPSFELWWPSGGVFESVRYADLTLQVNVHTQRDAVFGRATKLNGAVFRYEALPAHLHLQGIILTENKEDTALLQQLLVERMLLLGKARTAGYGSVKVASVERLPLDWREGWYRPAPEFDPSLEEEDEFVNYAPLTETDHFVVTFLSDAFFRDDSTGHVSCDPLPALEARLGGKKLEIDKAFRDTTVAGGFNRKWGLPLPQAVALAAGTVLEVRSKEGAIPITQLDVLEEAGLGLRRGEGFGRVTIDPIAPDMMQPAEIIALENNLNQKSSGATSSNAASIALQKMLLQRLLRRQLDQRLLEVANSKQIKGNIPNSQLARWQLLVRNALAQEETAVQKLDRIQAFFRAEKDKRSPAWQKMARRRIGKERLENWIDKVLTGENQPWEQFGYAKDSKPSVQLGDTIIEADAILAVEYKLRLIDMVFTAHAKQPTGGNHA